MRVDEKYTSAKAPGIRQWLADKIRPKDEAPPAAPAVTTKPAGKKSPSWGAILRGLEHEAAAGVDRDGQVLHPSESQRSTAAWLSGISPRSRD